jgi:hypothetical protein
VVILGLPLVAEWHTPLCFAIDEALNSLPKLEDLTQDPLG